MAAGGELKAVALAYQAWLKTAPARSTAPSEVQRRVVELLREHSWEEICAGVGISRYHLARWRRQYGGPSRRGRRLAKRSNTGKAKSSAAPKFVELAPRAAPVVELEVQSPNGTVVRARGERCVSALLSLAETWAQTSPA